MPNQKSGNIFPTCASCGQKLFTANFNKKLNGEFRVQLGEGARTTSIEAFTQSISKNGELVLKSIPNCQYCKKPLIAIKCAVSGENFKTTVKTPKQNF